MSDLFREILAGLSDFRDRLESDPALARAIVEGVRCPGCGSGVVNIRPADGTVWCVGCGHEWTLAEDDDDDPRGS